ncbi:MAG TPA: hypothetical protein VK447_17830 [Myxococcaceae bacterium]|nr:hypothetical protein [Myxococcaceae bacterium]
MVVVLPPGSARAYGLSLEKLRRQREPPPTFTVGWIPEKQPGDRPLEVRVYIRHHPVGAVAKLHYRRTGQAYRSITFSWVEGSATKHQAVLPAHELPAMPEPYELQYYLELTDGGRRLAGEGDASHPLTLIVQAREPAPEATPQGAPSPGGG